MPEAGWALPNRNDCDSLALPTHAQEASHLPRPTCEVHSIGALVAQHLLLHVFQLRRHRITQTHTSTMCVQVSTSI